MIKNAPVVIVRRKKGHGHGHHGGAWKVAYADFVTAMMAFFLVLWIVGQSKAVKAGVAGYFRNPGIVEETKGRGILPGSDAGIAPEAPPKLDAGGATDPGPSPSEQALLEKKAEMLREMLARVPEFRSLQKQIEIQVTREGLRIELIETANSLFFDTGSAVLKPQTIRLLSAIAGELGSLDNPVIIEGHSDSRRYSTSGVYSNWELSADRANAARRVMEQGGLHDRQVTEVRGYADSRLRIKSNPYDARNRRVSIIVSNQSSARAVSRVEESGERAEAAAAHH